MSATNRGAVRSEGDFYRTPAWCVAALWECWRPSLPAGRCLEPCAGDGALAIAAAATIERVQRRQSEWTMLDVEPRRSLVQQQDFLTFAPRDGYDLIITNPPYRIAQEIIQHALEFEGATVAMLLRLNFLASAKRAEWLRGCMPDVYVLPNRHDFTGGGGDATEYAWCVWPWPRARSAGTVRVLPTVPKNERRGGV